VVQLNVAGNTLTTGNTFTPGLTCGGEIPRRFGEAFGVRVEQSPVPLFFHDSSRKESMWRKRSTKHILNIQSSMDVALFGQGLGQHSDTE
jgi:DNA-binding transcriptional regulator LsrR (DeoR family)